MNNTIYKDISFSFPGPLPLSLPSFPPLPHSLLLPTHLPLLPFSVWCKKIDYNVTETGDGWSGSERDYTYDELLERAFNQLREKNPEMATGEKKKFVMKPPQVRKYFMSLDFRYYFAFDIQNTIMQYAIVAAWSHF